MSKVQRVMVVQADGWISGVGKWGKEREKKNKCLYLSRGDNHDLTPFLM
jgi:hypothetical protein